MEFNSEHKININRAFLISCCIDNDFNIFKQLINEIISVNKLLLKFYVLEGLKFAYATNTNERKIKYLESSLDFIIYGHDEITIYLTFICSYNSSSEILENFLKKYQSSRNIVEQAFYTACWYNNNLEIIKFFVHNKYVKPKRLNGDYLLLTCERNKNLDIIKYLLTICNENNFVDEHENNVFLMSCYNENEEVLSHISKKFKNYMYLVNNEGKNAFDIAIGNKNILILKYLINELEF